MEALFDSLPPGVAGLLAEAGFPVDGELVIKRMLSRSGRNRIYLNGSLCPLSVLAQAGAALVHIYGQHEHHTLLQAETHLNLLDAFAGDLPAPAMKENYAALAQAANRLSEARASLERKRRERALLEAQAEEIAQARLRPGEEEEMRATQKYSGARRKAAPGLSRGRGAALRRRRRDRRAA